MKTKAKDSNAYYSPNPLGKYVVATTGEHGQQLLGMFETLEEVLNVYSLMASFPPDSGGLQELREDAYPALVISQPGVFLVHCPEGNWFIDMESHGCKEVALFADEPSGLYTITNDSEGNICFADRFWLTEEAKLDASIN